ncbi:hypothetical protein SAMN05444004_106137 [Jannaschia faecimaris]|uniref:Uncharacterized protein n=1 Tax=Jannaschia faecimaris TaxID=1244108 RepID=A0A1H3QII7_9RHOB|nr:hypothetical protein [Jannaschia faecimaris]SDZ12805.1 hypothetical protein SAMN05444004_106137 [Jannaschia faecimaris]
MTLFDILALLGAVCFVSFLALLLLQRAPTSWLWPAGLSLAFLAWSLMAVASEGPWGFWIESSQNAWGVQIWLDLLLAIGASLVFLIPAARAEGMKPMPWAALVLCTGSIGLMAMAARVMWLRQRRP